jgi:DNA-binding response OmpR family regulator
MPSLQGVCGLVVEDEPIVALDLASMLADAGADVLGPALTAREAEKLSENSNIAVAVLDIRLGDETVASVADTLHRRGIPIIFHTGHGAAAHLNSRWPGSRVLVKPTKEEELLREIVSVLSETSSKDAKVFGLGSAVCPGS